VPEPDDFLTVKRVHLPDDADADAADADDDGEGIAAMLAMRDSAAYKLKKQLQKGRLKLKHADALASRTRFDDDGNAIVETRADDDDGAAPPTAASAPHARNQIVDALRDRLKAAAGYDREAERERIREKHRVERFKAKARERGGELEAIDDGMGGGGGDDDGGVTLGGRQANEGDESSEGNDFGLGHLRDDRSASSDDDAGSSSSDEPPPPRRKRDAREPAAPAAKRAKGGGAERVKGKAGKEPSLAELEAAALRMLER
jgi:hypothetical protein